MQLRVARLCMDCEEIHGEQRCPVCASETFVYLARWIPAEERRTRRRPARTVTPEKPQVTRWAQRGAIGVAAVALSRWLWQSSRRPQAGGAERQDGHHSEED